MHTATLCSHCFPVPWLRIIVWKRTIRQRQTRGASDLRASAGRLAGLPTLHSWPDRNLQTPPVRAVAKSLPSPSPASLCRSEAPRVRATKHRKQLVAGKATHKSDLDGSCILLGMGGGGGGGWNPSDIVMLSAHYIGVNIEKEWRWKAEEAGGWKDDRISEERRLRGGSQNVGQRKRGEWRERPGEEGKEAGVHKCWTGRKPLLWGVFFLDRKHLKKVAIGPRGEGFGAIVGTATHQ